MNISEEARHGAEAFLADAEALYFSTSGNGRVEAVAQYFQTAINEAAAVAAIDRVIDDESEQEFLDDAAIAAMLGGLASGDEPESPRKHAVFCWNAAQGLLAERRKRMGNQKSDSPLANCIVPIDWQAEAVKYRKALESIRRDCHGREMEEIGRMIDEVLGQEKTEGSP